MFTRRCINITTNRVTTSSSSVGGGHTSSFYYYSLKARLNINVYFNQPHHQQQHQQHLRSYSTTNNIVEQNKDNSFRVLFFGTDQVSLHTLKTLHNHYKINHNNNLTIATTNNKTTSPLIKELEVVCPNNKDELVYQYAKKEGLPMYHPDPTTGMKQFQVPLSSAGGKPFDIAVVVSFGYFIPKAVLSTFKYGGINVHPSLLPKYRGASPIYQTLLNDDKETGVSIIKLDPLKFDVGDILLQTKYTINGKILYLELLNELASIGANCVIQVLSQFNRIKGWAQGENGVSRAPKVHKDNGRIDWENDKCQDIWIKYRSYGDTISIFTYFYAKKSKAWKRVKLYDMVNPMSPTGNLQGISQEEKDSYSKMIKDLEMDTQHLNLDHSIQKNGQYFISYDKKQKSYTGIIWVKCNDGWVGFKSAHEEAKKRLISSEFFFNKGVVTPTTEDNQLQQLPSSQQFLNVKPTYNTPLP